MVIPMLKKSQCHWILPMLVATQGVHAKELSEVDFLASGTTVLTASRLAQPIMDSPNAITVLDRATIEASGYHNLSDLFRLVPGMYVGQIKGWFHSVSHTLADEYARRMQVLVDGRSIYLPSFGGVRWDMLPLAIDDIERIEVVRGPNAATYGANAYTGVINIITRHPEDVVGRMLHLVTGDQNHREGWFRWAGAGESSSHRLTLGRREDGGFAAQYDDERSNALNYRGEFNLAPGRALGVHFGVLEGTRGDGDLIKPENQPHDEAVKTYFGQVDYRQPLFERTELLAKVSFNHDSLSSDIPTPAVAPGSYYEKDLHSTRWHGEFQFNTHHASDLRSSWGGYLRQDAVQSRHYWNTADRLHANSKGVFGHLEWRMAPEWLLNAGAFWEDYETVGGKLSPRMTLSWQPSPRHTVRFGISKAYRNPVMFETHADWNLTLLTANGVPLGVFGPYIQASNNIKPEDMLSQEISYLGMWPEQGVTLDARLFKERIGQFISAECTVPSTLLNPKPCSFAIPANAPRDFFNIGSATQKGLEAQLKWQPSGRTQILANYAFLRIDSNFDERRYSPHHIEGLHLMHQFPGGIDLTFSHYWTSSFEPIGQDVLPGSRRWDAHVAKKLALGQANAKVAFGVENIGKSYREFSDEPENLFDTRGYVHLKVDF